MRDIKGNPLTGFRVHRAAGALPRRRRHAARGARDARAATAPEPAARRPRARARRRGSGRSCTSTCGAGAHLAPPELDEPRGEEGRPAARALDFSLELHGRHGCSAPKPLRPRSPASSCVVSGNDGRGDARRGRAAALARRDRGTAGSRSWRAELDARRRQHALHAAPAAHRRPARCGATGRWRNDGSRAAACTRDVERVRWRWLAEVFDNRTFDVPGRGRGCTIDAPAARGGTAAFRSDLTWDSLAVDGTGRFAWNGKELAIDSLAGRSLAGDFRGRVRWSKLGWEVGGEARDADPAHWQALRLVGWPEGRLNGRFLYRVGPRPRRRRNRA